MDKNRSKLNQLLNKSSLSEEEHNWLYHYLQQSDTPELRRLLLEKFADDLSNRDNPVLAPEVSERMLAKIHLNTADAVAAPVISKRFNWTRVAAACILLSVSALFFPLNKKNHSSLPVTVTRIKRTDVAAPLSSRATILLGNGQQIVLDSNNNGTLAREGEVNIEKTTDGAITYSGTTTKTIYNTLLNPRGSKPVSLTLSDGSKVWLNSESSLRYPVSFRGNERGVEITGEAYFEVQKNPLMPFRVSVAGKGTVEVLGTHFNVNSYGDEASTRITLLEGSVRVSLPAPNTGAVKNTVVIEPGQQALYANANLATRSIAVKNQVDLAAVMAWKNGYFNFDNADLYSVLRQLSRWYNIQVKYAGKIPERVFGGEIQRDLNLSEVLKLLEKNKIHFNIEDDQLIVRP